jgi:hypothetical protein
MTYVQMCLLIILSFTVFKLQWIQPRTFNFVREERRATEVSRLVARHQQRKKD